MTQVMIELPDTLRQELAASGLDQQQMQVLISRFLQLYLAREQLPDIKSQIEHLLTEPADLQHRPRFGSGQHLHLTMAEHFDEPLEDFLDYMQ